MFETHIGLATIFQILDYLRTLNVAFSVNNFLILLGKKASHGHSRRLVRRKLSFVAELLFTPRILKDDEDVALSASYLAHTAF